MIEKKFYTEDLKSPIELLELKFGGANALIRAAFECSFFVCPNEVRNKLVYFPDRARSSKEHYPETKKGYTVDLADGQKIKLEDNTSAQKAWEKYTGRKIIRKKGYGLRHIWGHPWNPNAYTAGWNFCYMPFWAGMLTEKQHPHEKLKTSFEQASWFLYFENDPVCDPPEFVKNPEFDLESILGGQPILLLSTSDKGNTKKIVRKSRIIEKLSSDGDIWEKIKEIRGTSRSWVNIRKATLNLQDKSYEEFSTVNVAKTSKSCVRKILKETGISLQELEKMLDENDVG